MKKRPLFSLTLEAIAHQRKSKLLSLLTEACRDLKALGKTRRLVEKDFFAPGGIIDVIRRTTKINAELWPAKYTTLYDMAVILPDLDRNNPLTKDGYSYWRDSEDGLKAIRNAFGARVFGGVDLDTGEITGVFAEIPVKFAIGPGWFENDFFTAEECGAALLHEIGHYVTLVEFMIEMMTTNIVLHATVTDLFDKSPALQVELIEAANTALGLGLDEKARVALLDTKDPTAIATVLISTRYSVLGSASGNSSYDYSSWEAASDKFASRHGATLDLATTLDKLVQFSPDNPDVKRVNVFLAYCVLGVNAIVGTVVAAGVTFGAGLPLGIAAGMIWMFASFCGSAMPFGERFEEYDEPSKRIGRLLIDARGAVKDSNLPVDYVKSKLNAIAKIELILQRYGKEKPLMGRMYDRLQRKRVKSREVQEYLESLANNRLFVAAQTLRIQ